MTKPKVILIGGCPDAGKTTLGRALAKRLDYHSLTIDDLQNAIRAVTTPESHPGLHLMNKPNFVEYFTESTVEKLIADAQAQAEALWPAIERTIQNHATWGAPIVIDGWHLRPEVIRAMNCESVAAFWIVIDRAVLEDRERQNDDFFGKSHNPPKMFERFLGRSLWANRLFDSQATASGFPILQQDGTLSVTELCERIEARI